MISCCGTLQAFLIYRVRIGESAGYCLARKEGTKTRKRSVGSSGFTFSSMWKFSDVRNDEAEARNRLLVELSMLRGHHESLQRQREDFAERYDPNMFGNNSDRRGRNDDELFLKQDDKDAIEALFASDDFAEMFNAGGHVSRVPVSGDRHLDEPTKAPVCRARCRQLSKESVVAFVSKSFDPAKPTRRRHKK